MIFLCTYLKKHDKLSSHLRSGDPMPQDTPIDLSYLRQCFGSFMTGVTVVTTTDQGTPIGFTANSFSSVSLDPPLLLICIDNKSDNFNAFTKGDHFGVNILADDQQDLSNRFASPHEDRFDGIHWTLSDIGNPQLEGAAAFFDCTLEAVHPAGDHMVMIGRIQSCRDEGKAGLGYHRGGYFTLEKK